MSFLQETTRRLGHDVPRVTGRLRAQSILADRLRARTLGAQETEAVIACNILNRMRELGRPASVAIGPEDRRVGDLAATPRFVQQRRVVVDLDLGLYLVQAR